MTSITKKLQTANSELQTKITKETPTEKILKLSPPCRCGGCEHGCTVGSGIFLDHEIIPLAKFLNISEEELKEKHLEKIEKFNTTKYRPKTKKGWFKKYGKCTFYDDKKGCTIHAVKPFECKISSGCNGVGDDIIAWFNLNHFVNENDPESLRQYAQYLKNGGKMIPGGELEKLVPDKKKRDAILNYKLLR